MRSSALPVEPLETGPQALLPVDPDDRAQPVRIELVRGDDDRAEREREVAILRRGERRVGASRDRREAGDRALGPDDGRQSRKERRARLVTQCHWLGASTDRCVRAHDRRRVREAK